MDSVLHEYDKTILEYMVLLSFYLERFFDKFIIFHLLSKIPSYTFSFMVY